MTVLPSATLVPSRTPTQSPTPTTTPTPVLTVREPSIEQLESYLRYYLPSDDPVYFSYQFPGVDPTSEWVYEDVNGDGEKDLVASGWLYVAILIWTGDRYSQPFQYHGVPYHYAPTSRIYLEDLTGDGVFEVIYDEWNDWGGTGFISSRWNRQVIHCRRGNCEVVWQGLMGSLSTDVNIGGMKHRQVDFEPSTNQDGSAILQTAMQEFSLYYCTTPEGETCRVLEIADEQVQTYIWNGVFFELAIDRITRPGRIFMPVSPPAVTSPSG